MGLSGLMKRVPVDNTALNVHNNPHHAVRKDSATTPIKHLETRNKKKAQTNKDDFNVYNIFF